MFKLQGKRLPCLFSYLHLYLIKAFQTGWLQNRLFRMTDTQLFLEQDTTGQTQQTKHGDIRTRWYSHRKRVNTNHTKEKQCRGRHTLCLINRYFIKSIVLKSLKSSENILKQNSIQLKDNQVDVKICKQPFLNASLFFLYGVWVQQEKAAAGKCGLGFFCSFLLMY